MSINLDRIKAHQAGIIDHEKLFRSAVCIPLIKREKGYEILFEVRSSQLEDQPGDICFPGGAMEAGEKPMNTAIRELKEELLVSPEQWEILGENDLFVNENMIIYPYIGILHHYSNSYNNEVEKVFSVPVDFFIENPPEEHAMYFQPDLNREFPYERIQKGKNYRWRNRKSIQYFYQYKEYCIWGITARILHSFIENFCENIEHKVS